MLDPFDILILDVCKNAFLSEYLSFNVYSIYMTQIPDFLIKYFAL